MRAKSCQKPGRYNSSITRVRPVFQQLLTDDPTGATWLPAILRLASDNIDTAERLATASGNLLPWIARSRAYKDRVLRDYGIDRILVENCFEHSLPPPSRFLRWLILHPEKMTPPSTCAEPLTGTASMRAALFGVYGKERQEEVQATALKELDDQGSTGSFRKWWAFEGFTEVDCYLETSTSILVIEGKRTEPLSTSTMWYRSRNQLLRNLESAAEVAAVLGKYFAVLVAGENHIPFPDDATIADSLPHFEDHQRAELMTHYLGCLTWREICDATDLSFDDLPDEVADVLEPKSSPRAYSL